MAHPLELKEFQAFLGLGNYFRKFVRHFSTMVALLTAITGISRAQAFNWNDWGQAELAGFEQLKEALTTALDLAVPDQDMPFQVQYDASIVGTGGVLWYMQQRKRDALLHIPVASSQQLSTTIILQSRSCWHWCTRCKNGAVIWRS